MGASHSSTSVVTRSVQHEAIRRERQLKAEEKAMLVIGLQGSGKSYLIKKLIAMTVDNYNEDDDDLTNNDLFIYSKYQIGPFIFNELTPFSIFPHATKNFKYLTLLNQYNPKFTYKDETVDVVIVDKKNDNKEYINYQLLFDGYFREFLSKNNIKCNNIPKGIGNIIESFYDKPLIKNYKIDIKSTIFDFWELSIFNKNQWIWCYKKAVCIIFIIDLSCFNDIDSETNNNKMSESIKLFHQIITNLQTLNGQSVILILNKKNEFRNKLNDGTNISIVPEFKHITDNDYDTVIENIQNIFRNIAKTIKSAIHIFIHTVGALNYGEIQTISNDFVHIVITYTLAQGGIVH